MGDREVDSTRPNIVLITTDTQRWDTLGCMGSSHALSPCLDKLAGEGVLFEQAHTSSPVCSPARTSLMTGLHTPVHGCIENGIAQRNTHAFFTDLLKEQGYTNLIVGKGHFGSNLASFDIQKLIKGEKSSDCNDFYARHLKKHGFARASNHPNPIPEEWFMDAFLIDTAIQEIDHVVKTDAGPFFAFCSLPSPHEPIDPPGRWASLYDGKPLPPIQYEPGEIKRFPLQLKRMLGMEGKESEAEAWLHSPAGQEEMDHRRRLYYGLSAYCDAQIGRLIEFLDQAGLARNTLVIFTSDHGTQLYEHGFDDKHNYYDASWRVPLIMRMPGTLPQNEKRDFAVWNDITATILGAAGIESPYVQGFDLFTPLSRGERSPRRCAVGTLYKSAALATRSWKLEYYFEEGTGRLFDRKHDPLEMRDLFESPNYKEVKNQLTAALLTWRADLSDIQYLIHSTGGGGPVARRIARHTKAMRGVDAERRLGEAAERIDGEF